MMGERLRLQSDKINFHVAPLKLGDHGESLTCYRIIRRSQIKRE
jgi:hypothetical protein